MNFVIDENLSVDLIPFLQKKGHQAYHIKIMGLTGIKNGEVYKTAQQKQAWLITKDQDFNIIEKFRTSRVKGIILINIDGQSTSDYKKAIDKVFNKLKNKFDEKLHVTITDDKIIIQT
jgi:predicted nuclease of predicted toxin-antitoxin system